MPRVWIAGHNGMLGRALCRAAPADIELFTIDRQDLDLADQNAVSNFISQSKPDAIFVAAGRVGGIAANLAEPVAFLVENLRIAMNCIHEAHHHDVRHLIYFGSACVYPKSAPQPMKVEHLLSGGLEPSNRAYALAKLAGAELTSEINKLPNRIYQTLMPSNLYGPQDNFDLATSHVIPSLISKFVNAKNLGLTQVEIWGDGTAMREFLHVDDCASAAWHLFKNPNQTAIINVGSDAEISIRELAILLAELTGFKGELHFQSDRPTGAPRRLLDCTPLYATGWRPQIGLRDGLAKTIQWYTTQFTQFQNAISADAAAR